MLLVLVLSLMIIILTRIIIFLMISKLNKSFFNLFTVKTADLILIKLLPVIYYYINNSSLLNKFNINDIILVSFLYLANTIFIFIGYKFSYNKTKINKKIPKIVYKNKYNIAISKLFLLISIIGFLLLAIEGVGIKEWIFNTRNAYQFGRKGLGHYYILFKVFLLLSFTFSLSNKKLLYNKKKFYTIIIFYSFLAYFSGSKGFLLSFFLVGAYFYDHYMKKIGFIKIIILGIFGFISFNILLAILNINLATYSDYYRNFLMLVSEFNLKFNGFGFGKYTLENTFWEMIPRGLYKEKPIIYGYPKIIYKFYGDIVLKGHYPSFGSLALPYVDFGILGIMIGGFLKGIFLGWIEKKYRIYKNLFGYIPLLFYVYINFWFSSLLPIPYYIILLIILWIFLQIIYEIFFKNFFVSKRRYYENRN